MKLKVCGMKFNTLEVATLLPDYLGFIFWEPSSRHYTWPNTTVSTKIKKVGVFVDASLKEILNNIVKHNLDVIQLHGNESVEFCSRLYALEHNRKIEVIKVFSIKDSFGFSVLKEYEDVCDYYLFDTKGKLPGGNGSAFNWQVLKEYPSTKPYFLSGGISLDDTEKIKQFLKQPEAKYCHALDVNSGFEKEPGLKDIEKLKEFITMLNLKF